MNCIFIYNPVSGQGKVAKKLAMIVDGLKNKYAEVEVYATKAAGDMTRMAREAIGKYDAIVFYGGDGSFNEIVQGLAGAETDELPELGYIPGGTVNDIAHTLKIPKNVKKALKIIKSGRAEKLDCMKINEDRYAMYVVAAGAFTSATYTTPQKSKNQVGRVAYWFEGIKKNLKFDVFNVECANETKHEAEKTHSVLISFMNSRYVAGFALNKKGSMQDGKIEAAIIPQREKPNGFQKIGAFFATAKLFLFGFKKKKTKRYIGFEGDRFEIETDENVVWNFDGEKGVEGKIKIEVVPRRIKVIIPNKLKRV